MDGFEVPIMALTTAGEASRVVADGVRAVDLSASMTTLAAALPGGAVQWSGAEVATTWDRSVTELADALRRHARALTDSAAEYRRADGRAADAMAGGR